ncbi:MAG TPA: hypothetical protein VEB43_05020 [Anaeromyxobacter sp.]|nr:hypothetical protein [Anaeromyxobacter sp.]
MSASRGPLARLARLAGGVALMQGRLGHQIVGQLLISGVGASDLEVAGATAVLTATSGQGSVAAQVAVRTVAPALAARSLIRRSERRILLANRLGDARRRALADALVARETEAGLRRALDAEVARRTALEAENERLRERLREQHGDPLARAITAGPP